MGTTTNIVAFPKAKKPVDPELQRYRLPKVKAFRDRLGNIQAYGRAAGIEDQKLKTREGFREFLIAYQAFMASLSSGTITQAAVVKAPKPAKIKSGTVRAAIEGYMASDTWRDELRPATASARKRILNAIADKAGDVSLGDVDREMIQAKIDEKPVTVRKNWRSAFRGLFTWAMASKLIAIDPSVGLKAATAETDGYRTWDETEIAQYLARHPVGTKARRVFVLALCTAQRRTDLALMGWQHVVEGGRIRIKQSKTGETVSIPILAELAAELAGCPKDQATFVVGATGKKLSPNALGDQFRAWVIEAGLPVGRNDDDGREIEKGLSLHGLRRAMCRRLVKAGVHYHTIMSITGHKTLEEIQRYCADYEKEVEADKGIAAIEKHYGAAA
jgi:integrase